MMKLQKPFHNIWCQILKWTAEHDCWKWRDPKHIGECYHCLYSQNTTS